MDKPVVTELIQNDLTEANLKATLTRLLHDEAYKKELMQDYKTLWHKLGDSHASENAAREIVEVGGR
jgi:lipid-A-disaccharide synthase